MLACLCVCLSSDKCVCTVCLPVYRPAIDPEKRKTSKEVTGVCFFCTCVCVFAFCSPQTTTELGQIVAEASTNGQTLLSPLLSPALLSGLLPPLPLISTPLLFHPPFHPPLISPFLCIPSILLLPFPPLLSKHVCVCIIEVMLCAYE